MLISLIVPCYNEEEAMPLFYQEAARVAAQMEKSHGAEFEIIFVDDGSKDGTLRVARELHDADPRVRYVSFSRNFGKEAGIYAGLKAAKGDYVATLDADLQDPPALLPDMLDALLTGDYDCAATRRTTREGEPPVRSWFARMFYRIINKMSDTEIVDGARDFRLMSRRMVDAVTAGWPSMVCIMLLCSGVQLFCLGIVGEYLAKTYLEVKHRPIYITRETEQDRDERKPAQQK